MAENLDLPGGCLTRNLELVKPYDIGPPLTPGLCPEPPAFDLDGSGRLSPPLVSPPFDITTSYRDNMVSAAGLCTRPFLSAKLRALNRAHLPSAWPTASLCACCYTRAAPTSRRATTARLPCTGHSRGTAACTISGCAGQPPPLLKICRTAAGSSTYVYFHCTSPVSMHASMHLTSVVLLANQGCAGGCRDPYRVSLDLSAHAHSC